MKLTITTLVIIEGSYIQGIFHSLEEHPGKAYQELVDLEEIISNTPYFNFNVDDAIYEVLTMPSRDGNPITRKQKSFINLRYQTYSNN